MSKSSSIGRRRRSRRGPGKAEARTRGPQSQAERGKGGIQKEGREEAAAEQRARGVGWDEDDDGHEEEK